MLDFDKILMWDIFCVLIPQKNVFDKPNQSISTFKTMIHKIKPKSQINWFLCDIYARIYVQNQSKINFMRDWVKDFMWDFDVGLFFILIPYKNKFCTPKRTPKHSKFAVHGPTLLVTRYITTFYFPVPLELILTHAFKKWNK